MRKIKFQAINDEGKIVIPDYIDRGGIAWWKENSISTCTRRIREFTGLKDKNGKEIFEGDIYKIENNRGTWIVVYHECAFKMKEKEQFAQGAKCPQDDFPLITMIDTKYIEVIGNIYQNPELL